MKIKTVKPRKLAGFRDFFAKDVYLREFVINTFKKVFERYGYEPLETPALEYSNIFLAESGEEAEKLFYRFKDQGGRDIMLKYEVMIPMCRAVAENYSKLVFPYKRYQIQKVWRADKPQKGRFREFTQCDADTIGSQSVIWDAEFIQMGIEALLALGFKKFKANISSRKFLNGIVRYAGASQQKFIPICLSIDKLPKIGPARVKKELLEKRKIPATIADKILKIVTQTGKTDQLLKQFKKQLKDISEAMKGLKELEVIFNYLRNSNVRDEYYQFAPFIVRGLAYYTGPIWEFEILEGNVGSVAGCGRYDNTIGRFLGRKVPATGGSFGIERIVEVIKDRKMLFPKISPVEVLVTIFNNSLFNQSLDIANLLRKNKINTMLYSEPEDNLPIQLKYANKKGVPWVIIIGPEEVKNKKITIKDMETGKQERSSLENAVKKIKQN